MYAPSHAAVAHLLLEVRRQPARYPLALRQPEPLFEHMALVLHWAAGRHLAQVATAIAREESELQHAATWLVGQTCLRTGAQPPDVLGLPADFSRDTLREHYRLLMRLTHPDGQRALAAPAAAWPADAAQRINAAHVALLAALESVTTGNGQGFARPGATGARAMPRRPKPRRLRPAIGKAPMRLPANRWKLPQRGWLARRLLYLSGLVLLLLMVVGGLVALGNDHQGTSITSKPLVHPAHAETAAKRHDTPTTGSDADGSRVLPAAAAWRTSSQ